MLNAKGNIFVLTSGVIFLIAFCFALLLFLQRRISDDRYFAVKEFRDFDRESHVNILSNAIHLFYLENGYYPAALPSEPQAICKTDLKGVDCDQLVDLSLLLNNYLLTYPVDPFYSFGPDILYKVHLTDEGEVVVSAPLAETREILSIK